MTYNIKLKRKNTKDMDYNNSSRRFRPWGSRVIPERPGVPTICMEYPEITGRIQMGQFIPVEIFRKKSYTFRGITFFPFLPKRPKFSVPFVWITSGRLHVREKVKHLPVFCKWYNSIPFLFSVPKKKKYQYHLTEIFQRNFRTNGKRF